MADATGTTSSELINSYTTDMLALETHIRTAVAGQIEDLDEHSEFKGALIRIHTMCAAHVHALEAVTQRRDQNVGGVSKVVKQAVSSILGAGAAAIDFLRTDTLPKDLRDDYAALSLAYIGSLMLHTTALTLGDAEIAAIAQIQLGDHAAAMMSLQRIIPTATVTFLAEEGMTVDRSVLSVIAASVDEAWSG
jgi:hypothetical protein